MAKLNSTTTCAWLQSPALFLSSEAVLGIFVSRSTETREAYGVRDQFNRETKRKNRGTGMKLVLKCVCFSRLNVEIQSLELEHKFQDIPQPG